jgi:hypothetical protein
VDFAKFSVPQGEFAQLWGQLVEYVTLAGGVQVSDSACLLGEDARPSVVGRYRGRVGWFDLSARAIRAFEASTLWGSVLALVGEFEHRVTGAHIALDRVEDGQLVVKRILRRGLRGNVRLTRKRVPGHHVRSFMGKSHTGSGTTGTVYLGRRTSDVWAKVYDKRNELLSRLSVLSPEAVALADSGPLTRYELALGRHVGLTLGDLESPAPAFWHHMAALLTVPAGTPKWEPGASGYWLPPRREVLPAQQLELLLDQSHDVRRMVKLADDIGPKGREWLVSRFTKRVKTDSGSDATAAAV